SGSVKPATTMLKESVTDEPGLVAALLSGENARLTVPTVALAAVSGSASAMSRRANWERICFFIVRGYWFWIWILRLRWVYCQDQKDSSTKKIIFFQIKFYGNWVRALLAVGGIFFCTVFWGG